MAFVKVASLSSLPPGTIRSAEVSGVEVAVCNAGGEVHVIGNTCPHAGGPLGEGGLNAHMVTCPWHAWEYDCRTGQNDFDPDVSVPVYAVRVEGDEILVDVSSGQ
jgi:nitrite reductase (NADH) small subunit/3-phenylpropionate/trans-cinnamate dioxygenase ferredoxin subunit